jgi:hypothetical protein
MAATVFLMAATVFAAEASMLRAVASDGSRIPLPPRCSAGTGHARHGRKTSAHGFDGYKGHMAADPDSEIIMATSVTPGNSADGEAAGGLLADVLGAGTAASPPAPARAWSRPPGVSPCSPGCATAGSSPGRRSSSSTTCAAPAAAASPWHLIVHEDVLIFRRPLFPGGSRELKGSQREPKYPSPSSLPGLARNRAA